RSSTSSRPSPRSRSASATSFRTGPRRRTSRRTRATSTTVGRATRRWPAGRSRWTTSCPRRRAPTSSASSASSTSPSRSWARAPSASASSPSAESLAQPAQVEHSRLVDLGRPAALRPAPDGHAGADQQPRDLERRAVDLREERGRLGRQVRHVPLGGPATGAVEVDPPQTVARAEDVRAVGAAVERALWTAQALEPAPELPERGGEEGSIVLGERQLDDQRLGALEGSVERRQRGRDRCQRLVQLLQRGGDI